MKNTKNTKDHESGAELDPFEINFLPEFKKNRGRDSLS